MNKKGFTLTELLVVVAIMAVITGMSIAIIRNINNNSDDKKYNLYLDTIKTSAKVYNNSYSEDLFGRKEYGCAYVTYEQLADKNLVKDIDLNNITCATDKTFVRIIKLKDKYGYLSVLGCKSKNNDEIKRYPKDTTIEINNNLCNSHSSNNINIDVDRTYLTNRFDKKRKTTKLILTSITGINNRISISTAWSKNPNGWDSISSSDWVKANIEVKGDQEEKLLNGEIITANSNQLTTPVDTGDYYLLVRVDELRDLYGNKWKNDLEVGGSVVATRDNYISYGPFKIDNEAPTIPVITGYKKADSTNITDISGITGLPTLETDTWYKGWEVTRSIATDELSDKITYQYRIIRGDETTTETRESGIKNNNTQGITTIKVKACDEAGNCSGEATYIGKIDRTEPSCGTVSGASTSWTKSNRTVSVGCSDSQSGCEKTTYDTTYSSTAKTGSVTIKDKVGNTNSCSYNVYVDKTAPSCGTATNSSKSWTKSSRTIKQACSDSNSGCEKSSYDTTYSSTTKTGSVTIKDKVGNTNSCSYNVYVDKTAPSCSCVEGSHGTSGVQLKLSCSDSHSGMGSYKDGFAYYTSTQTWTAYDKVSNSTSKKCEVTIEYEHSNRSWSAWKYMSGPYVDVDKCVANKPANTSTVQYQCLTDRKLYKREKVWGSWLSGGCASKSSDCKSRVSDYRLKK